MRSFLAQHVSTDRETFGYLLVGSTVLGPVDQGVFQGGRLVLALRLLAERSVAEAEDRLGRELLADALRSRGGGPAVAAVAGRLGYVDRGPAVVVVARPAPLPATGRRAEESARRALGQELAAAGQVLAGPLGDDVVAIARPEALAGLSRRVDELVAALAPDLDLRVGVSDVDPQMRDLARAHREATAAAALAARASVRLLRFTDLGLHRLMFDVAKPDRVDEHVERWIGPLLRYDAAQRANLVDTLARFLRCGNQVESARELSIHPSTLKYRLGRIREILGVDFLAADARFNIELALRLRESAAFMADHHTG
jgi:sugar diacid utilization regulator